MFRSVPMSHVPAWLSIFCAVTHTCLFAAAADPYAEVDSSWDRFGSVYGRIIQDYYAVVPPDSIMLGAIEGMLERLDAYSRYYDADALRQLRQDTKGRFAGLGVTVAVLRGYPVVVAPMEDTPAARAGLVPGDLIVAVEERSTHNMSLDEVVNLLRGEPGTEVRITLRHLAPHRSTRQITVRRELIRIPSVTLVDEIAPAVGYIGMQQGRFSEATADEVRTALTSLADGGVQGIILDLRNNPGGLLSQATQVADLFLPRGAPIVSIRERDGRREELRRSQEPAAVGELPLVVLIDGGSASASEIVAGAIQDNDRGIIVGTTSFGKGSVQTIFDLHQLESSALKLTTARYYTPSGRSIHRSQPGALASRRLRVPVGGVRVSLGTLLQVIAATQSVDDAERALRVRFGISSEEAKRFLSTDLADLIAAGMSGRRRADTTQGPSGIEEYHTRAGRRVFGGGGISPDIAVPDPPVLQYIDELEREGVFFQFAVEQAAQDSAVLVGMDGEAMRRHLLGAFAQYAANRDDLPAFVEPLQEHLRKLREAAQITGFGSDLVSLLNTLEARLDSLAAHGYPGALQQQLLKHLEPQVALRLRGRRAERRARLARDPQLSRAIELLLDQEAYWRTLSPGNS